MRAMVHSDGRLVLGGHVFRAAIGRGGVSEQKREGDGATPGGVLPLRKVLYRADRVRPPACVVPIEPVGPADGWCDDPADPAYNRAVRLPYGARHEELWRPDELYDVIGILGWNDAPVRRGRGSAIFLHVTRGSYAPTDGCVALRLPELIVLLAAGLTELEVRSG